MSSKTLTIKRVEEREISFKDWFPMVKGDFLTEQHAINKWEAMCEMMRDTDCGYSEYCDSSEMELEECEDALVSIAEDTEEVENECEQCGLISESNIVHSFGCVELCEACSEKDDEPQCPKKHAESESDPCEWCEEQWAAKEKQLAEAALLEASLATPAPPPPPPSTLEERFAAGLVKIDASDLKEALDAMEQKERDEIAMLMRMVREKAAKAGIKLKIEEE